MPLSFFSLTFLINACKYQIYCPSLQYLIKTHTTHKDMTTISTRHLKAWQRFNDDLRAFALETEGSEDAEVTLYEDATTTRQVCNFWMTQGGLLSWDEEGKKQYEDMMYGEDDAREWLSFWRANLRRARRYWAMDADRLDAIQEGVIEDTEE